MAVVLNPALNANYNFNLDPGFNRIRASLIGVGGGVVAGASAALALGLSVAVQDISRIAVGLRAPSFPPIFAAVITGGVLGFLDRDRDFTVKWVSTIANATVFAVIFAPPNHPVLDRMDRAGVGMACAVGVLWGIYMLRRDLRG